jgi:hypothetical protein
MPIVVHSVNNFDYLIYLHYHFLDKNLTFFKRWDHLDFSEFYKNK